VNEFAGIGVQVDEESRGGVAACEATEFEWFKQQRTHGVEDAEMF
jgi:hypothetical protein